MTFKRTVIYQDERIIVSLLFLYDIFYNKKLKNVN